MFSLGGSFLSGECVIMAGGSVIGMSPENIRHLEYLADEKTHPENQLPEGINVGRLLELAKQDYVRIETVVPPNREGFGEDGLIGFRIAMRGKDALAEREEEIKQITQKRTEEKAKDKAQRRREWMFFALGAITGYVLGWLNPLGFVTPGEVWAWLTGLLH